MRVPAEVAERLNERGELALDGRLDVWDLAVDDALDDGQRREFELGGAVEQFSDRLYRDAPSG